MATQVVVFDVLDERGSFRRAVGTAGAGGTDAIDFADSWLDQVSRTVARIASGDEAWRPWDQVIQDQLQALAPEHAHVGSLGAIGHRLEPWPDSPHGLARIHARVDTVALSNAGLTALMECSRAGGLSWSALLSSEMIRTAKPDPRVYEFLLDSLRLDPSDVLFVAAHPWDLRAAAAHGMRTAYVQRPGEGEPDRADRFDWQGLTLLDLADALESGELDPDAAREPQLHR